MKKYIIAAFAFVTMLSGSITFTSCEDIDDVKELNLDRLLSPTNLVARVRNKVDIELTWDAMDKAQSYVIEVFKEDPDFAGTPIATFESEKGSYTVYGLEGETSYSIRVKSVAEGIADSKWVSATRSTDAEQILYAVVDEDIEATQVTLRWPAGQVATKIELTPGEISYTVTAGDIASGSATITGLADETKYTAMLKNGNKTRGTATFETLLNLEGAIPVKPDDNLSAMLAEAKDGDVFALLAGTHKAGKLSIQKNISIKAAKPADKPVLSALISLEAGVSFELKDLILDGYEAIDVAKNADQAIQFNTAGVSYGNIAINGCTIRNYEKGLLYLNVTALAESITISNCTIYDIVCTGGDFFDCREGTAKVVNFTNNTVYNCANTARDFFRIDDKSANLSAAPVLLVDHNTFNNVSNNSGKRLLYVRWKGNDITFTNNILANTNAYYTNQSSTNMATMSKNNYFNAPNFTGSTVNNAQNDVSGKYTTLDPGFKDLENGDFTLSNEDLIYEKIGAPKWY